MVELDGVSRRYQVGESEVYALREVDLEVDQGEFVVVLGPSGSGKSTLLNIIGALDTPSDGRAVVAGREITGMGRTDLFRFRREVVSFIFQTFNLFPTLTALENVQCGAEITGSAKEARRRATEVLAQVGLSERLHHYPSELSGGEQQRVAIARAIAKRPEVLLCDEPTGALDLATGVRVLEALAFVNETLGATTAVITHNTSIREMAHRVLYFGDGKVSRVEVNPDRKSPGDLSW